MRVSVSIDCPQDAIDMLEMVKNEMERTGYFSVADKIKFAQETCKKEMQKKQLEEINRIGEK